MDAFEAIKSRRSIRKYTEKAVSEELVEKVLEAGRWAPSTGNNQSWKFIVLKDRGIRERIADVATGGKFLVEASVGIAVTIDPKMSTHPVEDGAIATQNMLLAAHSLGLGACWIGVYKSVYEDKIKKILNIPRDKRLLSMISIGFPAEFPKKSRKAIEEIVYVNTYGKKLEK